MGAVESKIITKQWPLPKDHLVELQHDTETWKFRVNIDKVELAKGNAVPMGDPIKIEFLFDSISGIMLIEPKESSMFNYRLLVEGSEVMKPSLDREQQLRHYSSIEDYYKVAITSTKVERGGKETRVLYRIETSRGDRATPVASSITIPEVSHVVYRSYREFVALHRNLQRSLRTKCPTHAAAPAFPALPPWYPKFAVDHEAASFIEARRKDLELYLQRLARLHCAVSDPEVLRFLQMDLTRKALESMGRRSVSAVSESAAPARPGAGISKNTSARPKSISKSGTPPHLSVSLKESPEYAHGKLSSSWTDSPEDIGMEL